MRKMQGVFSSRRRPPESSRCLSRSILLRVTTVACVVFAASHAKAVGPNFVPDHILKGSTTQGWHVLGQAQWRAGNGELVGSPQSPEGGWLVLDQSFADAAFYADVLCTAGCEAGVLFRMEKTTDGIKGVYFSVKEGDVAPYAVKLDRAGRIASREKLPPARGHEAFGSASLVQISGSLLRTQARSVTNAFRDLCLQSGIAESWKLTHMLLFSPIYGRSVETIKSDLRAWIDAPEIGDDSARHTHPRSASARLARKRGGLRFRVGRARAGIGRS